MLIKSEVSSSTTGVCIHCTFLESTATDCVVLVHPRVSQLSSVGLTIIQSSYSFHRSGDTASGCIEGITITNSTDYQIVVIGIRRKLPTEGTTIP